MKQSYEQRGRVRRVSMRTLICWGFRPDWCRACLSTRSSPSLGAGRTNRCTDGQVDGARSRCIYARLRALIDKRRRTVSPSLCVNCFKQFVSPADRTPAQLLHSGPKLWHNVSADALLSGHQHSVMPQNRCQYFSQASDHTHPARFGPLWHLVFFFSFHIEKKPQLQWWHLLLESRLARRSQAGTEINSGIFLSV